MKWRVTNPYADYCFNEHAKNVSFNDRLTAKNYCEPGSPMARIRKDGREYAASSAAMVNGVVVLGFGAAHVTAELAITARRHYFRVEVLSLSNGSVEEFVFLDIPLTMEGREAESFGACALALNLKTNVVELPGPCRRLTARCYSKFGVTGAAAAVIGCPQGEFRGVLKEAVRDAPDLPHSALGGPWALDAPVNSGSYLFNFGGVTEKTVDQWIRLLKAIGFNQFDFHGGSSFRFGDCEPNREMYPRGRASMKAVIDRLHENGILAGLHTYAFFLDKNCPWVTPVPDSRLGKDAAFTLARSVTADDGIVPVAECTKDMSSITGFFVRNSVTLQIDNELITYGGVRGKPPHGFTGCRRGVCGTQAVPHAKGARVHHLKECFGLFCPDGDSSLFTDVAAATADMFNECGFDMIYLDALDGEDILGGREHSWHYGSKFMFELWRRLKKPALMEMSTFHHHLWFVRSRMGAWDHPRRSHKRFIDQHLAANEECRRMFLPAHLGWWALEAWSGVQGEPTFADDIEYLCGKCVGTDTGFSLMGIDPDSFQKNSSVRRMGELIRRYETLRHRGLVPNRVKAMLKAPGAEFRLVNTSGRKWEFRPAAYPRHKIEGTGAGSCEWCVRNEFDSQPLRLRIEALMSAAPYDSTDNVVLADFSTAEEFSERETEKGCAAELKTSAEPVKVGRVSGCYAAWRIEAGRRRPREIAACPVTDHGMVKVKRRDSSWTKMGKVFTPVLNLGENQALGVWVYGDGRGELLNIQVLSPVNISPGIGDHYAVIDFTGWRYLELVETEGERVDDYAWPYSANGYSIYRECVDFKQVRSLSLWYNNLPKTGKVVCRLSPIKALKLVKATIRNPSISLGGRAVSFPMEMESGCYLEFNSMSDCRLYDTNGILIRKVKPRGDAPRAEKGVNRFRFSCDALGDVKARARVTLMLEGKPVWKKTCCL